MCAKGTDKFELHILSSEKLLPFVAAADHGKYVISACKYLNNMKDLHLCIRRRMFMIRGNNK